MDPTGERIRGVAGAICVMMLAVIRFPQPWAYNQIPPDVNPKIKPRYNVHICVPCYNEPSDIVFATCEAALQLRHPWAKILVYMLDDGRNLEREKKCMLMGNERMIYLARNKWPGVPIHGKASLRLHRASSPPTPAPVRARACICERLSAAAVVRRRGTSITRSRSSSLPKRRAAPARRVALAPACLGGWCRTRRRR